MVSSGLYSQIDSNKRKTLLIFLLFIAIFSAFSYSIGYIFGESSSALGFLIFGFFISLMSVFWSYYFSDKVVIKISRAKPAEGGQFKQLSQIVENLSIVAGIPKPKIYYIEDSAPNAFATGRNPKNSAIVVTTGLLQKLNRRELEGVIAHEIAHIKNYDILLATVVAVLVGSITLVADIFFRSSFLGSSDDRDSRSNAFIFFLALIAIITTPIIAKIIQMAMSRNREYLADSVGAYLTRDPKGLADALIKISQDKELLKASNRATAHLYIINPFKKGFSKTIASWFDTHPPVEERVKRLLSM